jgi:hypothetical protein
MPYIPGVQYTEHLTVYALWERVSRENGMWNLRKAARRKQVLAASTMSFDVGLCDLAWIIHKLSGKYEVFVLVVVTLIDYHSVLWFPYRLITNSPKLDSPLDNRLSSIPVALNR